MQQRTFQFLLFCLLCSSRLLGQAVDICPAYPEGPIEEGDTIAISFVVENFTDVTYSRIWFSLSGNFRFVDITGSPFENSTVSPINSITSNFYFNAGSSTDIPVTVADGDTLVTIHLVSWFSNPGPEFQFDVVNSYNIINANSSLPFSPCGIIPGSERPVEICPVIPPGPFQEGDIVTVNVLGSGFRDIDRFALNLKYDSVHFEFLNSVFSDPYAFPILATDQEPGRLGIGMVNSQGIIYSWDDGFLMARINFRVTEDTDVFWADLDTLDVPGVPYFVYDYQGVELPLFYCNGAVSTLVDLCPEWAGDSVPTGESFEVDLIASNFDSVHTFALPINYDTSQFTFLSASNSNEQLSDLSIVEEIPGVLRTAGLGVAGGATIADGEVAFTLNFVANQTVEQVDLAVNPTQGAIGVTFEYDPQRRFPITFCGDYLFGDLMANVAASINSTPANECPPEDNFDPEGLAGWKVTFTDQLSGFEYSALAQSENGGVAYLGLPHGSYLREWHPPNELDIWDFCPSPVNYVNVNTSVTDTLRSFVSPIDSCSALESSISSFNLRPCFDNNTFFVRYFNYGSIPAPGAYLDLTIPTVFSPGPNNPVYEVLEDGRYRFQLGDLAPNEGGQFQFVGTLDCDFPLGAAICTEAVIYPNESDCSQISGGNNFTGGRLFASSECDGDSVRFKITNLGDGPSGEVGFVIVEDVVIYLDGTVALEAGEISSLSVPANGSSYRLELELPQDAPYGSQGLSIYEGCGATANGDLSTGFATAYPLLDPDPWLDRYCQIASAAYDPNDKTATPAGVGAGNTIESDQRMEYRIRFQNTGTDTAFTVIIRDTIDQTTLDINSLRPGISSHDYHMNIEGNVLIFTFDNILLVDSFTNEPLSHGFVHFTIEQQPELPGGTQVANRAAIYFDFNAPIITPVSRQVIGSVLFVTQVATFTEQREIVVYPSPTSSFIHFALEDITDRVHCSIFDLLGRNVLSTWLTPRELARVDLTQLPAGQYAYRLRTESAFLQTGIIVKQ